MCSHQVTAAVTAFKADKLTRLAESLAAETLLGNQQQVADDDEPLLEEEKVREAWGMAQNTISEVRDTTSAAMEDDWGAVGNGRARLETVGEWLGRSGETVGCDGENGRGAVGGRVRARWGKGKGTMGKWSGRSGGRVRARWGSGRGSGVGTVGV